MSFQINPTTASMPTMTAVSGNVGQRVAVTSTTASAATTTPAAGVAATGAAQPGVLASSQIPLKRPRIVCLTPDQIRGLGQQVVKLPNGQLQFVKPQAPSVSSQATSGVITTTQSTHLPINLVPAAAGQAASPNRVVQVFVKNMQSETQAYKVDLSMDVSTLKRLIRDREGIPPYQQRLIFDGKQIEDGQSLADCGIQRASTIRLVGRLSGC